MTHNFGSCGNGRNLARPGPFGAAPRGAYGGPVTTAPQVIASGGVSGLYVEVELELGRPFALSQASGTIAALACGNAPPVALDDERPGRWFTDFLRTICGL